MAVLAWDQVGERRFETGVDRGVLYIPDNVGAYDTGFAWNGLVGVTESPTGAESNKQYADNQVYLNLLSAEEFGGTIEAFTYPDEFAQCDGTATPQPGISIGQQSRKTFGLCYRTRVGNDLEGTDHGYKIHIIYGALAAPSEKAYTTINESPEALTFSWELSTTPVNVPGYKPAATITIDSTDVDADALGVLEDMLYGTSGTDPQLPLPAAILAIFEGTVAVATPTMPTYNSTTKVITIPAITGIEYKIDGVVVAAGPVTITEDTVVTAHALNGYRLPEVSDNDWFYDFS